MLVKDFICPQKESDTGRAGQTYVRRLFVSVATSLVEPRAEPLEKPNSKRAVA